MNSTQRAHSRRGFTLVELLIAIAIVSILAAVALPSFQDQIIRSRRAEGKTALLRAAQLLERHYTVNNTYVTDVALVYGLAAGQAVYSGENPTSAASNYRITVSAQADCPITQCYTLTATQNGGFSDSKCGNLSLTSTGVRGKSGTETAERCWQR